MIFDSFSLMITIFSWACCACTLDGSSDHPGLLPDHHTYHCNNPSHHRHCSKLGDRHWSGVLPQVCQELGNFSHWGLSYGVGSICQYFGHGQEGAC